MDYPDQISAIDDSFSIVNHSQYAPSTAGRSVSRESGRYNGPRSGHWTAHSTLIGSGIDDGVPTIHGLGTVRDDDGVSRRAQPISGDVLRKLARATEDKKKKEEEEAEVAANEDEKGQTDHRAKRNHAEPAKPKKLYLPAFDDHRGIRIESRRGRAEVVKHSSIPPEPAQKTGSTQEDNANGKRPHNARAPSPQPSVRTEKADSILSRASQKTTKTVRIVGKNGEDLFMELPMMGGSSSRPPSEVKRQEPKVDEKKAAQEEHEEKAQGDAKAAKAAKDLREERERAAKAAAAAMISGGLPASSNASAVTKPATAQSVKSSSTDSKRSEDLVFDGFSKAPSIASSTTTVSRGASLRPASKATSKDKVERPEQRQPKPPQTKSSRSARSQHSSSQINLPQRHSPQRNSPQRNSSQRNSSLHSPPQSQPPYPQEWQDFGLATYEPQVSKSASSPQVSQSRTASIASRQPSNFTVGPPFDSVPLEGSLDQSGWGQEQRHSSYSYHHPANSVSQDHQQDYDIFGGEETHNDTPQTVFAGQGWISPHPLSVAPSGLQEPPESAIRLPSRNGMDQPVTMTYDEWKAMQEGSDMAESIGRGNHRNFSRTTSSSVRRRAPAQPRPVTVESLHSSIVGEKVQLRMPWDQ